MKPIPLNIIVALIVSLGKPLFGANIIVDGTSANVLFNAGDGVGG